MKDFSADRLFIFAMLMCAFFVSGGVVMLNDGDIGVGVGFCFFGVLFAAVPAVLMPFGYAVGRKTKPERPHRKHRPRGKH